MFFRPPPQPFHAHRARNHRLLRPPARQHDKALGAWGTADNGQREAEQEAGEQRGHAVVDAVGEHGAEPAVERLDAPEQVARAVGVLDGGGMHEHAEQQPLGVHCDVALAAIDLLGRVIAARSAAFRGLYALRVDDASGGAKLVKVPSAKLMEYQRRVGSRPTLSRSMTTR